MHRDLRDLLKDEYYKKRYDQLEEVSIDYVIDEDTSDR